VVIRISDTLIGALADSVENIAAPGLGAINHTFMGGAHPKTGRPYVWYEGPKAGAGAQRNGDGEDALSHIGVDGDTKDWAIERGEFELPLQINRYALRPDSGGPGKYCGGLGLVRDLTLFDTGRRVSSLWDRCKIPVFGLYGGYGGAPSRVYIDRKDGSRYDFPIQFGSKMADVPMEYGELLSMQTNGGGGYGDPLKREPESVARDLESGRISQYTASKIFGVVIDAKSRAVDEAATKAEREKLRSERIHCRVVAKKEEFEGRRRTVKLNPKTYERLGVSGEEPVEALGRAAAPLRLWVQQDVACGLDEIGRDEASVRMLRVGSGETVWVRDPFLVFRQYM
jgi:N-methylhydantoinase B